MRKSWMVRSLLVGGLLLAGWLMVAGSGNVEARPAYNKQFLSQYPDVKEAADKEKCNVCHYGKSKKDRNDYGKALATELKETNVKDTDTIDKALKAIESKDSSTDGKTFGDLLKEKKLPGKAPEET